MDSLNLYEETTKVATELYERSDRQEEIIEVATELYERSGRQEGRDLDNWLEAEKIIRAGEQFCTMFMQMLVQNPLSACKIMEAIKLLVELEQKKQLEKLVHSA